MNDDDNILQFHPRKSTISLEHLIETIHAIECDNKRIEEFYQVQHNQESYKPLLLQATKKITDFQFAGLVITLLLGAMLLWGQQYLFLDNTIPLIHDVAGFIFLLLAILCCVFHKKVKKDLIKNPLKSE